MNALDQHGRNMKRMINNVSQELGPRKGIEAVKARQELNKVAETNEEITDEELDEVTGAGSAGAFVAPMGWNNDTGMSKEINEYGEEEVGLDEYTSSDSSGAYTTPFGWDSKGKTTHNHHSHNYPDQDFLMRFKNDQELDEMTSSSSSGSYSQPAIWAKNKQNWRAVSDPNFPRYGGPGGKYVKIKEKCRHFPYCNQGDINALEFYEEKTLKEAIKNVSKKTNKSENYIKNIILQEMESMFKQDMKKFQTSKMKPYKKKKKSKKKYSKKEVDEMIKRGFYHSPITSLVGNVKMNKPIGQIYSMKGNKPKYE